MGRSRRRRPKRLGEKLIRIRQAMDLSQEALLGRLDDNDGLTQTSISGYELGGREPPLSVLLSYARLANVHLEVLADDKLDLPDAIPSRKTHRRCSSFRCRHRQKETVVVRRGPADGRFGIGIHPQP
jgi:transcriptional regulator with XRE-family HTH domain